MEASIAGTGVMKGVGSSTLALARKQVFLDFQSTTPVDPRVLAAMLPYFTELFGNPHSVEHAFGRQADAAVGSARQLIANVISAGAADLIFTSGATESNNLAIRGIVSGSGKKKAHVISCVTEHRSVLGTLSALERAGHAVTLLPVDGDGLIDMDDLAAAFTASTALVSIMAVNSEIGVIQPLEEIGRLCRSRGVPFHSDAAQAFGKIDINVVRDHLDALSISAHKVHGPKGIGALYLVPSLRPKVVAQITGGDQQGGLRAGTIPTPLAVGFGEAARLMQSEGLAESVRIGALRDRFLAGLSQALKGVQVNGSLDRRISGNLSVRIDNVEADSLLLALPDVALSTGSACSAGALEPSSVLQALGLSREEAASSFRAGFGRMTTASDVDYAVERIATAVRNLS